MKKVLFIAALFVTSTYMFGQHFKNVKVTKVLASDDFEGKDAWVNFDTKEINPNILNLNNALGGDQAYSWSDAWGGACVHGGKSAIAGENCVQLHWGGTLALTEFKIDDSKIYQAEVMIHPAGGIDDAKWNNWSSMHLMVFESSDVWQSQGLRIRITNADGTGNNPHRLALDLWEGEEDAYRFVDVFDFSGDVAKYAVDDAKDAEAVKHWIPLKVIFSGMGTSTSPFLIDFYLNNIYVASESFDNINFRGDDEIGLQKTGTHDDNAKFDNFKLTLLELDNGAGLATNMFSSLSISQYNGSLQINSDIVGKDVMYELYNVAGAKVLQGFIQEKSTVVSTAGIPTGIYLLKATDKNSGALQSIRTIIK